MADYSKAQTMTIHRISGGKSTITSTILNIIGMAFAFAALYIIMVQVNHSLGYNKKIEDAERIYTIALPDWYTPGNWMTSISRPLWEDAIENIACVESGGTGNIGNVGTVKYAKDSDFQSVIRLQTSRVSEGFLETFSFEPVSGSFKGLVSGWDIAVSESKAKELGINVGDILYYKDDNGEKHQVNLVAIFKDFQRNSDLHTIEALYNLGDESIDSYSEWSYYYFIKLHSTADKELFEQQATERAVNIFTEATIAAGEEVTEEVKSELRNSLQTKLFSIIDMPWEKTLTPPGSKGNKTTTYTLLAIAILITVIAFINFVNFFFALVPVRLKSVNTRKILGASRAELIISLLGESATMILVATALAAGIVGLFNGSSLATLLPANAEFRYNIWVAAGSAAAALILGVAASLYPAFYITSFSPAFALKGSLGSANKGKAFRYGLIGFQFVVSICLIICASFVTMQRTYMLNYDMGFDKENLLECYTTYKLGKMNETVKSRLLENPQIKDVTCANGPLVSWGRMGWGRKFNGEQISFQCYPVSWDFLRFMGIDIIEGRDFTKSDELCENGIFIFNKAAKDKFGFTLESKVSGHSGDTDIAGFCENFNYRALSSEIEPFALYIFGRDSWKINNLFYIRTAEGADMTTVRQYIQDVLYELDPSIPKEQYNVTFFEESLQAQYYNEQRASRTIFIFTALAILISLMGVFGMAMFEAEYRRREVSLRRVNGATIGDILKMFCSKFVEIVTVCFVIAIPVSWFVTDSYLKGFAYRISIHWWVFALAFAGVLAVTIGVVILRSWNAATSDPADTLRKE